MLWYMILYDLFCWFLGYSKSTTYLTGLTSCSLSHLKMQVRGHGQLYMHQSHCCQILCWDCCLTSLHAAAPYYPLLTAEFAEVQERWNMCCPCPVRPGQQPLCVCGLKNLLLNATWDRPSICCASHVHSKPSTANFLNKCLTATDILAAGPIFTTH